MKQLTITINVDPAAAVRAGRASVGETKVTLSDEDLASLSDEQRDALARHVAGEAGWGETLSRYATPVADTDIKTIAALLDQRRASVAKQAEEREAREAAKRAKADAALEARIAENELFREPVRWTEEGDRKPYADRETVTVYVNAPRELPAAECVIYVAQDASDEVRARYATARSERRSAREAAIQASWPEAQQLWAERRQREAREAAEYEALYARLPATLRDRRADGYATEEEIESALLALLIGDKGLKPLDFNPEERELRLGGEYNRRGYPSGKAASLTDKQYQALKRLRQQLTDVDVEAINVNVYRDPHDDDDPDDIDDDGDVSDGAIAVAKCTWEVGGLECFAYVPLV